MHYYDEITTNTYDTVKAPTDDARKSFYMQDRLMKIVWEKTDTLLSKFGLKDDDAPVTPAEIVKRIQDGKFVLTDAKDKQIRDLIWEDDKGLRWRDPEVKEDKTGFDVAVKQLAKDGARVKDAVIVAEPLDAIKIVQAFEDGDPVTAAAAAAK